MPAQLFATPANPIPENAHAGMLATPDGRRLRYARFTAPAEAPKGTVIVLPGRNECIEKYFETVGDLAARGFGSAVIDLRGQGGSERLLRGPARGHVESFRDYADDLEPFMRQVVLPDCRAPFYLLAHSTGALVALMAAPSLVNRVSRMVLAAPLLEPTGLSLPTPAARRLATLFHALGMGALAVPGRRQPEEVAPFEGNRLTADPARHARNGEIYRLHPQLAAGPPSWSWLRAAFDAVDEARDPAFMAALRIPTLFVAAGGDATVSTPAIERYARQMRVGSLVTIRGARHELLQEADRYREQFLAAFDAFVPGS